MKKLGSILLKMTEEICSGAGKSVRKRTPLGAGAL